MDDGALRRWYETFNRRHFHGALDTERWEVRFAPELNHRGGDCNAERRRIRVADYLRRYYGEREVLNTLLHEMVHQWQFQWWGRAAHDAAFWVRLRAIPDYTSAAKLAPPNPDHRPRRAARLLVYQCPSCRRQVRRRRRGTWSCAACDTRYNPRFRLVLVQDLRRTGGKKRT